MRRRRKIKGVLIAKATTTGELTIKERGGVKPPHVQKPLNRANCK